jgi:hypothetical protein
VKYFVPRLYDPFGFDILNMGINVRATKVPRIKTGILTPQKRFDIFFLLFLSLIKSLSTSSQIVIEHKGIICQ